MWIGLVIALVIGVVAGPIISLVPSKQQRTVASMRERAVHLGLRVRVAALGVPPNGGAKQDIVAYSLPWQGGDDKPLSKLPPWQLVRGDMDHDIHFFHHWDWVSHDLTAGPGWHAVLKTLFTQAQQQVPQDTLFQRMTALEWNREGIRVYWIEGSDLSEVDRLSAVLHSLKAYALNQNQAPVWPLAHTATTKPIDQPR